MKISVIIHGYKDRGFFDQSIKSALDQEFDDYDVTLSSAGNPALQEYADKYGIKFSLSSVSQFSSSVNYAIRGTCGEWIKLIDDDDLIPPVCMQNIWDNRHKGDLIQGNAILVKGDKITGYRGREITIDSFLPIVTNPVNWATVAFSRNTFDAIGGFDPMFQYMPDYDFYLNLLRHGYAIGFIDRIMGIWRDHPNQLTKTGGHQRAIEKDYLIKKYGNFIKH